MRKLCIITLIVTLLLSGCAKTTDTALHFELDSTGNYTGFKELPKNYTAEQAVKDGCYVRVNSETFGGEQLWAAFVQDASQDRAASIRIVNIWDDKVYYQDLYYQDGYYRIFDSSSEDLQDHKFKYMLTLEGILPNAAKGGKVTILTDDEGLTFKEVMKALLSSNYEYSKSISPFRIVLM